MHMTKLMYYIIGTWNTWWNTKNYFSFQWEVEEIEHSGKMLHPFSYMITVQTGLKWRAGTSSTVWFTLYGKLGDTGVRRLGSRVSHIGEQELYYQRTFSVTLTMAVIK